MSNYESNKDNKYTTQEINLILLYRKIVQIIVQGVMPLGIILNLCRTVHPLVITCLQPRLIRLYCIRVQKMACRYRALIFVSLKVRCARVP